VVKDYEKLNNVNTRSLNFQTLNEVKPRINTGIRFNSNSGKSLNNVEK
jgi:hypothetical protein